MSTVKVRNTQNFQKWFKKNEPISSKIVERNNESGSEYLTIDLTYYSTSMGDDIEASKKIRTIVSDFKGKKVK